MIDIDNFDEIKKKAEELYELIGSLHCPYFKDLIHFNTQGLEHLTFKRREVKREVPDQFMRYKLLHLVPAVLGTTTTLQRRSSTKHF